jgi:asparagine synthase (glutamine-hydrolysing)
VCGILGWSGSGTPPFGPEAFESALRQIAHRGPDDSGTWRSEGVWLGHRRLSIIDLSPAGHQPMPSASRASWIVFNGEIYNYVELRRELLASGATIGGGSDTGVLLELLERDGPDVLRRLNGMWAFGAWDERRRRLLLGRDRFGVKPLYFHHGPRGLAFASEPKALLALFPDLRRIDEATLLEFLGHNRLYAHGRSFYAGIAVLPPAHYGEYDPTTNSLRLHRYWDYPAGEDLEVSDADAEAAFAELFDDAVRLRMRSDVPVGVTLSGGLDSTAVLSASRRVSTSVPQCFTSIYGKDEPGELAWASRAADVVGASLTPVPAPKDQWLDVLSDVAWHMDGPGYSPAVYPLWRLMKTARAAGVPVLLEGQGADEALAGYPQYAVLALLDAAQRGESPAALWRRFAGTRRTFTLRWTLAWLARELSPALLDEHRRRSGFQSLLRDGVRLPEPPPLPAASGDRVRTRLLQDHSAAILPGLLHYGDSVSMAHSIESRHPFLDYRLVEWLFRTPTAVKLKGGETKWVLRRYLRAVGQPDVASRRDKQGYPTPAARWLASDLGRDVEQRLVSRPSPLHEWIEPARIARLFRNVRRGALGQEHHLYKLLSTQTWIDRCVERVTLA